MNNSSIAFEDNFTQMYESYYHKIYNYVYFRVLKRETTEDLVGDIFLKLFDSRKRYNPEKSALSTWIFTVAKNCVIDFYRKEKSSGYVEFSLLENEIVSNFNIENLVVKKAELERAVTCLSKLTERERIIIYMKFYLGLSYKEIAGDMNLSEKNVSIILCRAVKKLKKIYEDFYKEDSN